jgi:hypothetical protein
MGSKAGFRVLLSLSVLCAALSLVQRAQVEHALFLVAPSLPAELPQLAIQDFDGDRKPDIAEVRVERNDPHSTRYSINVRLTSGVDQSIGLTAPFGGLQITPRDVNGDNALDLIVSTTLQNEPVAVLLNDGNGNFSKAEPTAFAGAFSHSNTSLYSASHQAVDAVGVPPQSDAGISGRADFLFYFRRRESSLPAVCTGFPLNSFLSSHAGRAPPYDAA